MTRLVWTTTDSKMARADGWDLFHAAHWDGTPFYMIQRIDWSAWFADDQEAREHVMSHTDPLCHKAIALITMSRLLKGELDD